MVTLHVTIQSTEDDPDDRFEYLVKVPKDLADRILELIAHGILFDHDWSQDKTEIQWWIA